MTPPNPKRQRASRERLVELLGYPHSVYAIHYACQSFERAGSPSVASIAVRNLGSSETHAFSIHQEIELESASGLPLPYLDRLEATMLARFFAFLAQHRHARFVHWKMRDVKYGFAALEHRFGVLGGTPFVLHDSQRVDLAALLEAIYGPEFCAAPTFETLARLNRLSTAGLIAGADEPRAFADGAYFPVLKSTIRKSELIGAFARLAAEDALVTEAKWWQQHAGRVREWRELYRDYPLRTAIGGVGFMAAAAWQFLSHFRG